MAQWQSAGVPHLVILAPGPYSGRRIELSGEHMVVGREAACDIRFDDPHVSRTHATLQRRGDTVHLQDLGSSGGTFVNGARATERQLRSGDVIRFATVQARFETAAPDADATRAVPAQPGAAPARSGSGPTQPTAPPAEAPAVSYSIGHQQAGAINNVGRDQYQAYFQQVVHERDGFLREVAAAKTKARWIIVFGFVLFVVGFAMFVIPGLGFDKQIEEQISSGTAGPVTGAGGPQILGIPMQDLGWIVAMAGILTAGAGSVLHQVAVARRKRVDREHPLPQPWQPLQ
jgi:pSer/pThr/pTyr-binding forkhead associated (FHA) protein